MGLAFFFRHFLWLGVVVEGQSWSVKLALNFLSEPRGIRRYLRYNGANYF